MREVKFRGKTTVGEWIYGDLATCKNRIYICEFDSFDERYGIGNKGEYRLLHRAYQVIPETVGQYIQTIEENDIYVGDIVKAYRYGDKEANPFIKEIKYRNGTYWFGDWTWIEFLNMFRYVEVVGNIYDYSELIKYIERDA